MRKRSSIAAAGFALAAFLSTSAAAADSAVTVAGGPGQQALAVTAGAKGLRARVCAGAPCGSEGGTLLEVPESVRPVLEKAKTKVVELSNGRRVLRLSVKDASDATWEALLAAPPSGGGGDAVVWLGFTGMRAGEAGDQRMSVILEEPLARGRRLLVGAQRDDATICGRPAAVSLRELDPATLTLAKGASAQSLGEAERAGAPKIAAQPIKEPAAPPVVRLLGKNLSSSSVDRRVGTLTDGDPETVWSEDKNGDGRGEFTWMSSATEVPIRSFEIVVRPRSDVADGVAPRLFYLVTDDRVFAVSLPADAWRNPSVSYAIPLPTEVRTACVALVLEQSSAPPGTKSAKTTVAELTARTAFDGTSIEALVGALAGGGERARAAGALLERGGPKAATATIAGYAKLDGRGKELAFRVIDGAKCSEQVPFYAERFAEAAERGVKKNAAPGELDPEFVHARDRLRICKTDSAGALAKLVAGGGEKTRVAAARELPLVSPSQAVRALLDILPGANEAARSDLVGGLAIASRSERARSALEGELALEAFQARPEVARLALLRAIGPGLGKLKGAPPAFASLAAPNAPFATRYLLQGPAAELALAGDPGAREFLRSSLRRDADPHVRMRAAEVAFRVPVLAPDLAAAMDDPEVRVRQAAVVAVASERRSPSEVRLFVPKLTARLKDDEWTFVRSGAARAFGAMPAEPAGDGALAQALDDDSPEVRGQVLEALGARKALAQAGAVRKRVGKSDETLDVRAKAILALGAMCDAESLTLLTGLAPNAKNPKNEMARRLGTAAANALGMIHPADLEKRLAPLLDKDSPPPVKELAKNLVAGRGTCSAGGS